MALCGWLLRDGNRVKDGKKPSPNWTLSNWGRALRKRKPSLTGTAFQRPRKPRKLNRAAGARRSCAKNQNRTGVLKARAGHEPIRRLARQSRSDARRRNAEDAAVCRPFA